MALKKFALTAAALMPAMAFAADFQSCVSIKIGKDRLACFDKYAIQQTAETEASTAAATKAADLKAQQDAAAIDERKAVLTEVERFKTALTSGFKDPSSAQFKNVVAYGVAKPLHIAFLCGQVNAKNSYGAYIGFKRFFMIGTSVSEVEDSRNGPVINEMWPTTCNGAEVYRQE